MRAQVGDHTRQEQFIWVLVLQFAPVRALETQKRRCNQHDDQEYIIDPGVFFVFHKKLFTTDEQCFFDKRETIWRLSDEKGLSEFICG